MAELSLDEFARLTGLAGITFSVQTVAERDALPKGLLMPGQRVTVNADDTTYEWNGSWGIAPGGSASILPASSGKSPHLIGFWPLNTQNGLVARDTSGNRNHWIANGFAGNSLSGFSGASGWATQSGAVSIGKINHNPMDMRYDIGGPNQSFIMAWEFRKATTPTTAAQCLIGKGGASPPSGALGLWLGMRDNGSNMRVRVAINNGVPDCYSSNIPWVNSSTVIHAAIVRDAFDNGGRIKVFLNGVLDTGFNTTGFATFNPTASFHTHCLSLLGISANTTSQLGAAAGGANDYGSRNLQLYVTPPGIPLPSNYATLISQMAADPTKILTAQEML